MRCVASVLDSSPTLVSFRRTFQNWLFRAITSPMAEQVRIFVGTPANNEDLECQAVLDYSLRKHASLPLDITWMMLSRDPSSFWYSDSKTRNGWNTQTWITPFSALRWGIPAACDFQGRAIYMDTDMIAMADIVELWAQPIPPGKAILAKGNAQIISCVMLMDCAALKSKLPHIDVLRSVPGKYRDMCSVLFDAHARYAGNWNCRDGEDYATIHDPDVKILHYSSIPTQPNHRHARARLAFKAKSHWYDGPDLPHPRDEVQALFDQTLADAITAGRGPDHFHVSEEFGDYGR